MFGFKSTKNKKDSVKQRTDKELALAVYPTLRESMQSHYRALMEMKLFNHTACRFIMFNAGAYVKALCQQTLVEWDLSTLTETIVLLPESKLLCNFYNAALAYDKLSCVGKESGEAAFALIAEAIKLDRDAVLSMSDQALRRFILLIQFIGIDVCFVLWRDERASNAQGLLCSY